MKDLIKQLTEAYGPSGYEHAVRSIIQEQVAAHAVAEREVEASVARNNILAEQFADRLELISDDGRWCRHKFFHWSSSETKGNV